jgi:hypothetical protein
VVLLAGRCSAEHAEQGQQWHPGGVADRRPVAGLIDERLADVEAHGLDA